MNDPLFGEQFGLGQLKLPAAWAQGARGSGAVIAVVDGGVDLRHPDLMSKLVPGEDFAADRKACAGPQDQDGHGTHVSGIAAASADNGIGVAGAAPDARIMPVRVLDENGEGTSEAIVRGVDHAAKSGADVINLSLGVNSLASSLPIFQDLEAAVQRADDQGAVVVVAAGNDSFPLCAQPAAAANAVCVGATDRRRMPSFYSNFPNDDDAVGVRAPGGSGTTSFEEGNMGCDDGKGGDAEDIWSTFLLGVGVDGECSGGNPSGYDTLAGTSMAAPYVSGVAALLVGTGLGSTEIRDCLARTSVNPTSGNRGAFDPVYGYGIVDAEAAVRECAPPARNALAILERRVRLSRSGVAAVRISCRGSSACRGKLGLRTVKRFKRGGSSRRLALGSRSFAIQPGRRAGVRVQLSRAGRRLVRREHRIRVLASARQKTGRGDRATILLVQPPRQ